MSTVYDTETVFDLAEARRYLALTNLRASRERVGISQAAVASALGVSTAAVSRWEAGVRRPRGRVAVRYAALLRRLAELNAP